MTKSVAVIGGGVAGLSAADLLAREGYQVTVYEGRSELLAGTSDATPCRLGVGFHYPDEETSLQCLRVSLNLIKNYPHYKFGADNPKTKHLQRSRYFIVKDSQFPKEKILSAWKKIQNEYTRLVNCDPSNAVFGPPENFIVYLKPEDYINDIEPSKVELAVETAECFLNWPLYKKELTDAIFGNPNINVELNSEVVDAKQNEDGSFKLLLKSNKTHKTTESVFPSIVNASWQNIEALDIKAGFQISKEHTPTNRIKVMIEVALPKELSDLKSMFFCFGAHGAFTNLGNGRGFITYEPVTNIVCEKGPYISENSQRYLMGQVEEHEKEEFGRRIIEGLSNYIPAIKKAKFISARFGNVKTYGDINLNHPESAHHKRRELGVRALKIGWIDDASMKLVNCKENAEIVLELVKKHEIASVAIKMMSVCIADTIRLMDKKQFLELISPSPLRFKIMSDWKDCLTNRVINSLEKSLKYNIDPSHLSFWYGWTQKIVGVVLKRAFLNTKFTDEYSKRHDKNPFSKQALQIWINHYFQKHIDPAFDIPEDLNHKRQAKSYAFLSKTAENSLTKTKSKRVSDLLCNLQVQS